MGRGCLFGPVFAAAVILDPEHPIRGLDDSKALSPDRRQLLAARIRERAVACAVAGEDAYSIDRWNILQASRRAMKRAVEALSVAADFVYVDALSIDLSLPQKALIKGDARCASIAAASIIAKVARDEVLQAWHRVYPEYALDSNKGYGAPRHYAGLDACGPTAHHRFSFAPVAQGALF